MEPPVWFVCLGWPHVAQGAEWRKMVQKIKMQPRPEQRFDANVRLMQQANEGFQSCGLSRQVIAGDENVHLGEIPLLLQ
jgi:hypothetical protein